MKLEKNTILLTGGTSGIGLELLRQLYALDNTIIVTSTKQSKLDALKSTFPEISTLVCDLGDEKSVHELIGQCREKYQGINVLINNAGIQNNYDWTTEKNGRKKIENEIRINFTSPMQLIYGLLPLLSKNSHPAIINVSSTLAFVPKRSAPIYCATKAAIHSATKAIRYQLEDSKIKVFEIIPPLVETPMTEGRGKGKITPKQLVDEFLGNFKKDKYESSIGKAKLLRLIQRIAPRTADNILKNG